MQAPASTSAQRRRFGEDSAEIVRNRSIEASYFVA